MHLNESGKYVCLFYVTAVSEFLNAIFGTKIEIKIIFKYLSIKFLIKNK